MRHAQSYCPELPFNVSEQAPIKKQAARSHRATDSEGRFACEPPMPTPEVAAETESRRNESVWKLLRIKDEEIRQLRAQIEMFKNHE